MFDYKKILFGFSDSREKKLRAQKHYMMWDMFFYRPLLWHHSLRVAFIIHELAPIVKDTLPNCDIEKACVLALVHDDAEIITGDIPLGHKELMTRAELQVVHSNELAAIDVLSGEFPIIIGGYVYRELLLHALHKDCIEAQLVSYADKLDAYCESMHEVLGGNISALWAVIGYVYRLEVFKEKYPLLAPMFRQGGSPFLNLGVCTNLKRVDWGNYHYLNKPHTLESIEYETDFIFYNLWRKLVVENLGSEGVYILTTQVEGK